jgi:hypothetical protein
MQANVAQVKMIINFKNNDWGRILVWANVLRMLQGHLGDEAPV